MAEPRVFDGRVDIQWDAAEGLVAYVALHQPRREAAAWWEYLAGLGGQRVRLTVEVLTAPSPTSSGSSSTA